MPVGRISDGDLFPACGSRKRDGRMTLREDWSASTYLRFEDERTRPAVDLLARVAVERPRKIFDIGCGPGNSTELLAQRFTAAEVVGVDSSPDMLAAARERLPKARFVEADVA